MAGLLFIPAGGFGYWQAWVFLAVYTASTLALTLYLAARNPALLARRMRGGPTAEKQPAQKLIMLLASIAFIGVVTLPAFDHRFGWSQMAPLVALAGDVLILLGWIVIFFVFKANSFAASTVELAPEQTVVSTGPYGFVRHPMYAGGLLVMLGTPIALGSWWGLLFAGAAIPLLVWRLIEEEKFLAENLPGYRDYQKKLRYRLIPGLW
ncbi:membrane protein [Hypericibacter adhaerens]|uniref:Membrane protein n=1 Tax=Hypericibacter adhaerens TaxID=2602016 RepID=A0A5J6MYX3_9PROT|nr:isoprenylcysteine carboxylmethyltransferase family protein [Hypericibacter adhaerens]QEX21480.1 membrane protein [Hypericibacter adhaerens]